MARTKLSYPRMADTQSWAPNPYKAHYKRECPKCWKVQKRGTQVYVVETAMDTYEVCESCAVGVGAKW